jgi:P4 family phage/plasmid primase-like protien
MPPRTSVTNPPAAVQYPDYSNGDTPLIVIEALRLYDKGLWVVPTVKKECHIPNWPDYRFGRSRLQDVLTQNPFLNIGIVLGKSGLIDVETDSEAAKKNLPALFGGSIPLTPTYRSKRGLHRLFRTSKGLPAGVGAMHVDEVEFRLGTNKGAISLVPPSFHPEGVTYQWLSGLSIYEVKPAELPAALVARLCQEAAKAARQPAGKGVGVTGHAGLDLLLSKLDNVKKTRNGWQACCPAHDDVNPSLSVSLGDDGKVLLHCHAGCAYADILKAAGVDAGLLDDPITLINGFAGAGVDTPQGRTDCANAERLVEEYHTDVKWVGVWDKFLLWDSRHWKTDYAHGIQKKAKAVAAKVFKEAAQHPAKENIRFAAYTASKKGLDAMVSLAKEQLHMEVDDLDQNPWLLNVKNGTIDLETGKLRDHDRDDYITKLAAVEFSPYAKCPLWKTFLRQIFADDEEMIGYVQRLVGYCLTGLTTEHILPFLHGDGANGKSTLCETLMKLIGRTYAIKASPELLLAKKGEAHPTERADLFGKRLVFCIETEAGRRLAEAIVKEMTGGDTMRARRMREDFWEFVPTHHIWLASNHKPAVWGTDKGIWRRIKLLPFVVSIPPDQQDLNLKDKLRGELSGILNWALEGCRQWQRGGMKEPEKVSLATEGYKEEEDVVGEFIASYCERRAGCTITVHQLWRAYLEVRKDAPLSQRTFSMRMRDAGFVSERFTAGLHKGLSYYSGLWLCLERLPPQAGKIFGL